jgi:hypothetical protein
MPARTRSRYMRSRTGAPSASSCADAFSSFMEIHLAPSARAVKMSFENSRNSHLPHGWVARSADRAARVLGAAIVACAIGCFPLPISGPDQENSCRHRHGGEYRNASDLSPRRSEESARRSARQPGASCAEEQRRQERSAACGARNPHASGYLPFVRRGAHQRCSGKVLTEQAWILM